MMAQEMYEENKMLKSEIKSLKKRLKEKTLQQKAIEASAKRTEIAGEVNTEWTPLKP